MHRVRCGLAEGVEDLLTGWVAAGRSQSILSMYGHEDLVPLVEDFGIESRPLPARRRDAPAPSGGSKAEHMVRHLDALRDTVDPRRTVVIGDAADDAVAARHAGAHAVLWTGGSHGRAGLEAAGVPVVDSPERRPWPRRSAWRPPGRP
ncbi:hypothetical protein GCM10019016_111490 [Streptomyces prasinosporus]|uniref:HAD family hydrolase n=1 Tax=Streptomyces prasinosporus TaxID=68256 RepID=A0ABP6U8J0_9ACTN